MPAAVPYVSSIVIDEVIDALKAFVQPFVGTNPIVRGQVNRVPMPLTGFVVLTELLEVDLETPSTQLDSANNQLTITAPTQINVQIDIYGPAAGDQCKALKTIFRSIYSPAQFPDGIKPLYCSDGLQSPLISGEEQWESRFTITASLQYNPSVTVPQQSADTLAVKVLEDIP
jgi:hypothetical protein